ncbi:MAG: histidine phosphatase family protein [Ignavibacteria bacterium]
MKIFFIRHAEAIDYETPAVRSDEYRYITPEGRKTTKNVAAKLHHEFAGLQKIFTSPLIRAVQTAEIFAAELDFDGEVEIADELKNESATSTLQQMIKDTSEFHNSIAFVGHEPKFSQLVKVFAELTTLNFEFKKSGVCLIDFDMMTGEGKLEWYFDPEKMGFIK